MSRKKSRNTSKQVPDNAKTGNKNPRTNTENAISVKPPPQAPRGLPKSGRVWKQTKTRFSSTVKTKGNKMSFKKLTKLREELKRIRDASKTIKAQRLAEEEKRKERRRENLSRKEENARKSEVVQVISDTGKIKRTRKKQLRQIEKRDVDSVGGKQINLV